MKETSRCLPSWSVIWTIGSTIKCTADTLLFVFSQGGIGEKGAEGTAGNDGARVRESCLLAWATDRLIVPYPTNLL